ncbi:TetR family transcriptional regulator [Subtercola frigoramans]|uniref:TetR family transcriptional regulator n=1 Tax=Subtercola frigoramans TaxID=120298 RepID=UPI0019609163
MPRSRTFHENALLDPEIEWFSVRGYSAASLAQLSALTSVTNGSLYHAYTIKRGLFLSPTAPR